MRVSIKAKQIAGVTAIVGIAVLVLSTLYVTRLSRVVLHESDSRAQLLTNAILHRTRELVVVGADPYAALRTDRGLYAILQSSLYGEGVTDASILDPSGTIVASSDEMQVGKVLKVRRNLTALVDSGPIQQLQVIYSPDGEFLELRQPIQISGRTYGSVSVGVSTLLMRKELNDLMRPALAIAAGSLIIGIFVAGLLAQLLLRPIHVIRSGLTRLGKGEFGASSAPSSIPSASSSRPTARCSPARRRTCRQPSSISRTRSRSSTRRASCCSAIRRCSRRCRPIRSAGRCRRCCRATISIARWSKRRSRHARRAAPCRTVIAC
jgi:hypothetical protein